LQAYAEVRLVKKVNKKRNSLIEGHSQHLKHISKLAEDTSTASLAIYRY